jgi:hypothetical protein
MQLFLYTNDVDKLSVCTQSIAIRGKLRMSEIKFKLIKMCLFIAVGTYMWNAYPDYVAFCSEVLFSSCSVCYVTLGWLYILHAISFTMMLLFAFQRVQLKFAYVTHTYLTVSVTPDFANCVFLMCSTNRRHTGYTNTVETMGLQLIYITENGLVIVTHSNWKLCNFQVTENTLPMEEGEGECLQHQPPDPATCSANHSRHKRNP